MMSAQVVQLTIPGMAGKRRPSSPRQYREALLARTMKAREEAKLTREEMVERLSELSGTTIKPDTYKKWETRTPIPHHLIIPFCEITGSDPWELLTGTPFRLGRPITPGHPTRPRKAA